jgi:hypothetical protein
MNDNASTIINQYLYMYCGYQKIGIPVPELRFTEAPGTVERAYYRNGTVVLIMPLSHDYLITGSIPNSDM